MEIFDSLTRKIRIVYAAKGNAWVKHNGIKTDANGVIISGRYIELDKISLESLVEDGLGLIMVENETTGDVYELDLTTTGEDVIEEVIQDVIKEEEKPKRKRRTKKEIAEAKKSK
jgi:hypothetical protein|tara:strand:+ start:156 stop:500 length:345 start_codon:yes stop_codon:yes gene_type:complete